MRQIFCDWHMPNFLPEIKIDYDEYFENIKKTGAKTLIFMAKSAHGNCLFPSKIGITNKTMKGDIFGEIAKRSKKMGLQFIAYYNMVLNNELVKIHPEWRQVNSNFKPLKLYGYETFCMSNEDFKEHVCQHMEEIARNYEIDGFFLDLQYFHPDGCFCESCKNKFKETFGCELDAKKFTTARHWLNFYDFQVKIRTDFILSAKKRCDAIKPNLIWTWNGSGNPSFSIFPDLDIHADFLCTEAHPPDYLAADVNVRYGKASGKPFVLMMPEGQGSWGDWTLTTPETFKGLSAISISHGGALNIDHVPYPCGGYGGKVPAPVWETVTETFNWVEKREKFCADKETVPIVGCLHSIKNLKIFKALSKIGKGPNLELEEETHNSEIALTQILMESHIPLDFLNEDSLERLNEYELLILPHIPYVNEKLANQLKEYVRNGGNLLATYQTSLMNENGKMLSNFSLSDLFGLDLIKTSDYSVSYLDRLDNNIFSSVPKMPLLLKDIEGGKNPENHVLYCRVHPEARILGYITDPIIESDFSKGYHIYHDHAPPGKCTDYPGIVVNNFGKGKTVFLPVPFFKAYRSKRSPFLKEVLRKVIVEELRVSKKIQVEAPVSVEVVLMQDEKGWLLHLIHIQKETNSIYLEMFERKEPIKVRVSPCWKVADIHQCLSGEKIPFKKTGSWIDFMINSIIDHHIVRIQKKL